MLNEQNQFIYNIYYKSNDSDAGWLFKQTNFIFGL